MIVRADERYRSMQPGIESWHTFAAGAHYDATRLGIGPLVGVDEHVLAPGAGFAEHAHRGVDIVSWVVAGTLRHRSSTGCQDELLIRPGQVLVQRTGDGIRHVEDNPSAHDDLCLLQMTLVAESTTREVTVTEVPVGVGAAILTAGPVRGPSVVIVLSGQWLSGSNELSGGDVAAVPDSPAAVTADAKLLSWQFSGAAPVPSTAWTEWNSGV